MSVVIDVKILGLVLDEIVKEISQLGKYCCNRKIPPPKEHFGL